MMKKAYDLAMTTDRKGGGGTMLKSSASQYSLSTIKGGGVSMIDEIKNKLAYEWKNIFRSLTQQDLEQKGTVQSQTFIKIIH
jgi:flagellar motor switch protein FliG